MKPVIKVINTVLVRQDVVMGYNRKIVRQKIEVESGSVNCMVCGCDITYPHTRYVEKWDMSAEGSGGECLNACVDCQERLEEMVSDFLDTDNGEDLLQPTVYFGLLG